MAVTKSKKKKKELIAGVCALCGVFALLFLVAFGLFLRKPEELPPEPETTAPTLPPPEANPYTPQDFQYDGNYLSCVAGESVLGIDVSYHQGEIDWQQVKEAGVEFVILRVGYRGYQTGDVKEDVLAQANYQGAKAAGLKIGVYFFSQAIYPSEAIEEALFTLHFIKDWTLDLPVVYDWEYVNENARTANADARTVTDCIKAFCSIIERAGYRSMVYFNRYQGNHLMHLEELTEYPFWLAMYQDRMAYPYKVDFWQYSCTGQVDGIAGDVDLNLWLKYD